MFPTTKDSCTVNGTSICNHLSSPPQQWGRVSLKMSTPSYGGTVEYIVQWQSVTASAMQNGLEEIFTSAVGPCALIHMRKTLMWKLRHSRAAGMQGVDHCINGLTARLMYKAADRAMGVEKTKQQAKGNKERDDTETARETARLLLDWEQTGDDMDVTAAGAVLRRLWSKSNNVNKLC